MSSRTAVGIPTATTSRAPWAPASRPAFDPATLDPVGRRALRTAVRHLNAPPAHPVAQAEALGWLRGRGWKAKDEPMVLVLLEETEPTTLIDLAIGGAVTWLQLDALAASLLPHDHPTRAWLPDASHV